MTTNGDRSSLVTDALNLLSRNTPRKLDAQFRPACFAHILRASGQCALLHEHGFTQPFTQCLHAHGELETPVGANCLALVRSQVRTIGTRPPMRISTRFALLVRTLLREARANQAISKRDFYAANFTKSSVFDWQYLNSRDYLRKLLTSKVCTAD